MFNLETKEIDKEHTTNPVPLILAFQDKRHSELQVMEETKIALAGQEPVGVLADIAPTILQRIGLTKPQEMTGQDLKDLI
jgi:2,3-bisphosphoglycerate-independent phosphoglycerate mutase